MADDLVKEKSTFWLWVIIVILAGAVILLLYSLYKKSKSVQTGKLNKISAGALIFFAAISLVHNLGIVKLDSLPWLLTFVNVYVPVNGIAEAIKILEIFKKR
jgi:hypothetical protein